MKTNPECSLICRLFLHMCNLIMSRGQERDQKGTLREKLRSREQWNRCDMKIERILGGGRVRAETGQRDERELVKRSVKTKHKEAPNFEC